MEWKRSCCSTQERNTLGRARICLSDLKYIRFRNTKATYLLQRTGCLKPARACNSTTSRQTTHLQAHWASASKRGEGTVSWMQRVVRIFYNCVQMTETLAAVQSPTLEYNLDINMKHMKMLASNTQKMEWQWFQVPTHHKPQEWMGDISRILCFHPVVGLLYTCHDVLWQSFSVNKLWQAVLWALEKSSKCSTKVHALGGKYAPSKRQGMGSCTPGSMKSSSSPSREWPLTIELESGTNYQKRLTRQTNDLKRLPEPRPF